MRLSRDAWNDWAGLVRRVEDLGRVMGAARGLVELQPVRESVPRGALAAAVGIVRQRAEEVLTWADSLLEVLEQE